MRLAATCLLLLFVASIVGCSQKATPGVAANAEDAAKTADTPEATDDHCAQEVDEPADAEDEQFVPKVAVDTSYISEDFVGAVVIHPKRIIESVCKDERASLLNEATGFAMADLSSVEQIVLLFAPIPERALIATPKEPAEAADDEPEEVAKTDEQPTDEVDATPEQAKTKEPATDPDDGDSPDFEGLFAGLPREPDAPPQEDFEYQSFEELYMPSYLGAIFRFSNEQLGRTFATNLIIKHQMIDGEHEKQVYYRQISLEDESEEADAQDEDSPTTALASLFIAEDGTVLLAPEELFKAMLSAKQVNSELVGQLKKLDAVNDIVGFVPISQIAKAVETWEQTVVAHDEDKENRLSNAMKSLKSAIVEIDFDGDQIAALALETIATNNKDHSTVDNLKSTSTALLETLKKTSGTTAPAMSIAGELIKNSSSSGSGRRIQLKFTGKVANIRSTLKAIADNRTNSRRNLNELLPDGLKK